MPSRYSSLPLLIVLPWLLAAQQFEGYSRAKKVQIGAQAVVEAATDPTEIFPTSDVDINIPEGSMEQPDAIGVIIGISSYSHPDVPRVD